MSEAPARGATINHARPPFFCGGLVLVALFCALALVSPRPLAAQDSGPASQAASTSSHYMPMGYWAYRYVDLLISRGRFNSLQPLIQPYRRLDIAAAVQSAQASDSISAAERGWLDLLEEELAPELRTLRRPEPGIDLAGNITVGSWGVTQRHRDQLRPEGDPAAFFIFEVDVAADIPNVATHLRFRWDNWFLNDPQFPDGKVVEAHPNFLGFLDFGARAEEGYAELQVPYVRVFAGRIYRNWGLPGTLGLLVSNYSYSYDQVGYRLGSDRFSITGFFAPLDEFPGSVKRWFSAHRLDWRVNDKLSLSVGESVTWGGENRSFDYRMAMPIAVWLAGGFGKDFVDGSNSNNSFSQFSAWWKPTRGLTTYATIMFDDFLGGGTAPGYGLALGLQAPSITDQLGLRIDYAQVAALTYRSPRFQEVYTFRDIGLGHDKSDYDLLSAQLDWLPHPRVLLSPAVEGLRRGEDDIRTDWPAGGTVGYPWIWTGQREYTLRLGLRGQWRPGIKSWIDWDVGQNWVWNETHVRGQNGTEFVGRIRVNLTTRAFGRF